MRAVPACCAVWTCSCIHFHPSQTYVQTYVPLQPLATLPAMPCLPPLLLCRALPQLAEAEKELKRLAFEKALALPDEKPMSEQASTGMGTLQL